MRMRLHQEVQENVSKRGRGLTNRLIFRVAARLSSLIHQAAEQIVLLRGPGERTTLTGSLWASLKCSFPQRVTWRAELPVDFLSADVL